VLQWPKRNELPRVIAIANQKGGVGKTTTTVNLGAALAELDYRVLVIDLDPQGNATTGLGVDARNFELSMYDVIMRDQPLEDCIEPTSVKNLFVAPATIDLAGIEIELVPGLQPGAEAQAGHRHGGGRLRLRPDRLPPVARAHHGQRPGRRRRGPGAPSSASTTPWRV
jgi:cellulose biosynthesis protein BcsQ